MVARLRRVAVLTAVSAALPLALLSCSGPVGSTAQPTPSVTVSAPGATGVASSPATSNTSKPAVGSGATTTAGVPASTGVTISRTGGLAGVMQQVAIAADGTWTFTDRRAGDTQQGKLTTAQREQLASLAADPAIQAESRGKPLVTCADGYIYTIGIGEASLRYDQCGGGSGRRPVTDQLLAIVLAATPM
jgi:hypothetical protein